MPEPMQGEPQSDSLLEAASALVTDAATADVVRALETAGVRALVLRGPALAELLYESPGERSYTDVDLLVEARLFAEAEAALRARGYRESTAEAALPDHRPRHAHTWTAPPGVYVDLHRTLIGVGASPADVWRVLAARTRRITVGGRSLETPCVAGLALIVALHAAHHAGESARAVEDLERSLDRLPPAVWAEAAGLARELEALAAFAAGLHVTAAGAEQIRRLGVDAPPWAGDDERGDRLFHVAQTIVWLGNAPGAAAKATLLRRRLFPSAETMRHRSSLARHGRSGLLLAYALRLGDAARVLPAAAAAVRRARR